MADVWKGEDLSRATRTFDKNLELRDVAAAALVATGSSTGIAFNPRTIQEYSAVLYVTAVSADATATYVPTIEVSDTVGGTYVAIGSLPNLRATGAGNYVIGLHGDAAKKLSPTAAFIRVTMTITGSTPSLTFGAYLARASS
jgi:hypothetical protein